MTGFCGACGREWGGSSEAHCATCCASFTCDSAFDKHLAPLSSADDCYPPASFTKKDGSVLFEIVERASGLMWRIADQRQHPYAMRGNAQIETERITL